MNDARSRQPDRDENGDELGQSETPVYCHQLMDDKITINYVDISGLD